MSLYYTACRLVILSHFNIVKLWGLRTQLGEARSRDERLWECTGEGGFKPAEYVRISTVNFPFSNTFSIKKKNENDQGNTGFIEVTSE